MTETIIFCLLLGAVAGYSLKAMLVASASTGLPITRFQDRCEKLTSVGHGDRCDLPKNHEGPHRCVRTNGIRLQDTFWWADDR